MVRSLRVLFNKVFRRNQYQAFAKLKEAHVTENEIRASYELDPSLYFVIEGLINLWNTVGGVNFVRWTMLDPATMKSYELVLGRDDKHSPAEISVCFLNALRQIDAHPENAAVIASTALQEMGYKP